MITINISIYLTVPSERNLSRKEYEKISKYKYLEFEMQKMWHMKAIPVAVGGIRYGKEEN